MITAIEIENFKAIGKRVRVELKPLTLLFGPNSAGKSTILQTIHYAHEIFERHNLDAHRTESGGNAVDLGGFKNLVHNHDLTRPVRLRFEVLGHLPWYGEDQSEVISRAGLDWQDELDFMLGRCNSAWVEVAVVWCVSLGAPRVASYEVGLNGQFLARTRISDDRNRAELERIDLSHPVLAGGELMPPALEEFEEERIVRPFGDLFWATLGDEFQGPADHLGIPFRGQRGPFGTVSALPWWDQLIESPTLDAGPRSLLGESLLLNALSRMIVGPGDMLLAALRAFRYLGPLRQMPPRNYEPPRHPDGSRWANGLAAWDALSREDERVIAPEPETNEPTIAETAEDEWGTERRVTSGDEEGDRPLIDEVNGWLVDRLKAGYSVRRKSRTEVDMDTIPPADTDPGQLRQFFLELKAQPTKVQVVLLPHGQSIEVQPHDVGTGISQLLPVVVLALDSRKSLAVIEQPELHLHPALQTELGDLFIESALRNGNTILIETHSEHLMLRLLRRIEETHSGDAPGKWPLHPDRVSVVFVEQIDGAVRATPLRIDETGEFIDRWPRGFFEERADELF